MLFCKEADKHVSRGVSQMALDQQFSVLSFFCGCGGLDLGFRGDFDYQGEHYTRLPFDIKAAYDFNAPCVETYNQYFGGSAYQLDLSQAAPEDFVSADVLIGGFPCQEFSSCGPLGGLASDRGQLYKVMVNYMRVHRPKVVVGENVINLLRMEDGEVIRTIVADLVDVGYRVEVWNLYAPDYGIPQRRNRLFFICVRDDLKGFPEKPLPLFKDKPRSILYNRIIACQYEDQFRESFFSHEGQYAPWAFLYNEIARHHGFFLGEPDCFSHRIFSNTPDFLAMRITPSSVIPSR